MGLLDKVKGALKGKGKQVSEGVDKVADVIQDKLPDQHDAKVDKAAEAAKDQIEKLDDGS